jgi:spermidine/putrescine transport system permease protein
MADAVVLRGELASRGRLRGRALLFGGGALLWLTVFMLLPGFAIAALAFATRGPDGVVVWDFHAGNLWRLAGRTGDGTWHFDFLVIALRTLWLSVLSTVLALALAFPICFLIASQPPRRRLLLLALVTIPFCTNVVVRTIGWMQLFSNRMWPAQAAQGLGLIEANLSLAGTLFAVTVGLVSNALPMAILPLFPSVERLDWSLAEAARDLYGGRWRVFRHAILPQLWPGLSAAFVLTFIPSLGTFVTSDLLGGGNYYLVGNYIDQQFYTARDWPFGALISLVLVLSSLIGLFALRHRRRSLEGLA